MPAPFINSKGESVVRFLGLPTEIRAAAETTGGAFGLIESVEMPPGFASPYHTHHREDEAFYVIEGELEIIVAGKWLQAGPGAFAFGPREIPHGFRVVGSSPARMLLLCTPGGFEGFVRDLSLPLEDMSPPDMEKLMAAAANYHIDIHGPLPERVE